ncbi:hypothetical protein DIPPA_15761 [Diplonema papillatum]|nr:hypothetical protein DIPPA_23669 [Diplonema papillatum]KAJ9449895.1 hypothetical protein DIPPA_15761 [Diplonema papillatum]
MQHYDPSAEEVCILLGWMTVGVTAGIAASYKVISASCPKLTPSARLDAVDNFFAQLFYPVLVYLAVMATYELIETPQLRWAGTTVHSYAFMTLYLAKSATHIVFICNQQMSRSLFINTLAHHILSLGSYLLATSSGRMHFFGCLAAVCEITNIFLSGLYNFKIHRAEEKYPRVYAANGISLWATFLLFRILLFPYWYYQFVVDVMLHGDEWFVKNASPLEYYGYPFVIVVIHVLSLIWFVSITKGMLKVMFSRQKDGFEPSKHK